MVIRVERMWELPPTGAASSGPTLRSVICDALNPINGTLYFFDCRTCGLFTGQTSVKRKEQTSIDTRVTFEAIILAETIEISWTRECSKWPHRALWAAGGCNVILTKWLEISSDVPDFLDGRTAQLGWRGLNVFVAYVKWSFPKLCCFTSSSNCDNDGTTT